MPSSSDLTAGLRAYFNHQRRNIRHHPPPEKLTAYHAGRLPAEEEAAVREHLAGCPECAALVLELDSLYGETPPPAGDDPVDLQAAAAWQRLRSRLFAPPAPAPARRRPARIAPWAAAAALALVSVALAFWVTAQRQIIADLRQPRVNPPLVNLAPVGSLRQATEEPPVVRFPAGASRAWLILNPEAQLDATSYRVELLTAEGRSALTLADLQPSEAGNFRLELPRELLPAGTYRVLLAGRREGRYQLLEEFAVGVSDP